MFVCLSLVGGRGRSNFCDVNCARRYSGHFQALVRKVTEHLDEYKKGFNSLYAKFEVVWMSHVKLLRFKV